MSRSFSPSRRRFLVSTAFATSGTLLGGCVRRIPSWLPPTSPDPPLTIDVHCHFFNGTDLQMKGFLSETVNSEGNHWAGPQAASLAADIIEWGIAPTAKSEKKKLDSRAISQQKARERWEKAHAAQSDKLRRQLEQPQAQAILNANGTSPPSKQPKNAEPLKEGGTKEALEEYVQYRYVALFDYLNLYNDDPSTKRKIDLAIAHLVDYDWPLNHGRKTKTSLNDQVELMKQISIVSQGRVHTFAPFCPLREVAFRANIRVKGVTNWSSLEMVQRGMKESGCIGVKLYPTMGFAPYGNAQIPPDYWDGQWKDWLPKPESVKGKDGGVATIGERLDEVLGELYAWCLENDVPIMAHSERSNGLSTKFNSFAGAEHWAALRASKFGNLRLNLGHLGGIEETSAADWSTSPDATSRDVNARDLVVLMSADSTAAGGRFYGDSAYNEKVLTDLKKLQDVYRAALSWKSADQPRPLLPDRMMYGSDWSLLMLEQDMKSYFSDFVTLYAGIDSTGSLSEKFFGENAVDYLGLQDGATRQRLVNFYKDNQVKFDHGGQPIWMQKITT